MHGGRRSRRRGELVDARTAAADRPEAHLNLGILAAGEGRSEAAEAAYRTALRLDPFFLPVRFNLATLLNRQGRNAEAESVLRAGIDRVPDDGELHYSLGLLLAEEQRLDEAPRVSAGRRVDPGPRASLQPRAGARDPRTARGAETAFLEQAGATRRIRTCCSHWPGFCCGRGS